MASIVRAGPTKVDWRDAAELDSTASDSRMAKGPITGPASAAKTFPEMSSLPSPNSPVPIPENIRVATATRMYSRKMMTTVSVAARPGVVSGFFVSSFIVRVTSQPQKMKIDRETPAAKAEKDGTANGLNQLASKGRASNAEPLVTCTTAEMENHTSTISWKATSTYCTALVVSIPRYET